MLRIPTIATPLLLALAPVIAQAPAALPQLADATPLQHPTAPRGLRGLTVCLAPIRSDARSLTVRATHYLARLLEGAGADVTIAPIAEPGSGEVAAGIARDAGSLLLLEIAWSSGADPSIDLPRRSADDPIRAHETRLARALSSSRPGSCPTTHLAPPHPTLTLRLSGPDDRLAHREPTQRIFDALVDWWRTEQNDLRKLPTHPAPRTRAAAENSLWPVDRPPATEAEVAAILDIWHRTRIVDGSQVYLDVEVVAADDGWELRGSTELPILARAVRRTLEAVGVRPLRGELRLLPDATRLGGKTFGIVQGPAALTWRVPGRATGLKRVDPHGQFEETQLLSGEPVHVLDLVDDHLLVHALSGYLGWVPEDTVHLCDEARFRALLTAATIGGRGDGSAGQLAARVALARRGTPYVFGGRSDDGIDCSGLCQTSWAAQGVFLPRDARQQILCGLLVATARQPAPLEPGDLLFFANPSGDISHVGMSLGGWRFVHATPPEVTVGSLDPDDEFYARVAERFVLAKRVAR